MSYLASDSIFWVEVGKINPNPYQPRREFNEAELEALADSIRQYGVLQPLVVTRRETPKEDGGIEVRYELIAGERRLRASKKAGLSQVPVVIRTGEDDNKMKLELAIIENLQREDLNPVDRAKAFQQFVDEFGFKHAEIAKRVGKSREFVSNSLRLLSLPDEILSALIAGKISEGHARPIMMLKGKPEEQMTLFKEIVNKKLTVRDAESIARRSARDKIRKRTRDYDPQILQLEKELTEQFGTRVHIEPREVGGKITIDFFSDDDLKNILALMNNAERERDDNEQQEQATEANVTPEPLYPQHEEPKPEEEPRQSRELEVEVQKDTHDGEDISKIISDKSEGEKKVSTVAFGGKQQESSLPNNPLGEVLRSVLEKESVHKGQYDSPQENPAPSEHVHVPTESEREISVETEAELQPEQSQHIIDEDYSFGTSDVENEDDDFELPDMSSFKTEVSSLLHSNHESENDVNEEYGHPDVHSHEPLQREDR